MSTNPSTLRNSLNLDFSTLKGFVDDGTVGLSRVKGHLGLDLEATGTTATNAINFSKSGKDWLNSVIGAFDNNPLYHQILENEREARKRMDDDFTSFE